MPEHKRRRSGWDVTVREREQVTPTGEKRAVFDVVVACGKGRARADVVRARVKEWLSEADRRIAIAARAYRAAHAAYHARVAQVVDATTCVEACCTDTPEFVALQDAVRVLDATIDALPDSA